MLLGGLGRSAQSGEGKRETASSSAGPWQSGREEGKENKFPFLFLKLFFKAYKTQFCIKFEFGTKISQHSNKSAAASMHKHVSSLMVDFNFSKNLLFPMFKCTHKSIYNSNSSYFKECKFPGVTMMFC